MPSDAEPIAPRTSTLEVLGRHLVVVITLLVVGAAAGWLYGSAQAGTYTSTARVLINPSVGNPFVPAPSAVRQDELTSMETEAEVARSDEVLSAVTVSGTALTSHALADHLRVSVPPNTQVLEISYTADSPATAQRVADAVASAYLANRTKRFEAVNNDRIDEVESQTKRVLGDLRTATAASHRGTPGARSFQAELATALRNELVSLRAERTALETSAAPAGGVISPATAPGSSTSLVTIAAPVAGALAGLFLGYLCALGLERSRRVVRSAVEVQQAGLRVAAAVPARRWRDRLLRRRDPEAVDGTIRRLRSAVLEADPRPAVVAVAPAATRDAAAEVSEALAASLARAGHRSVLVHTDAPADSGGLVVEHGLASVLLHDRLNALELLQPTAEPMLCVLPAGECSVPRADLLDADRVRAVTTALEEAGNLVVLETPGIDTPEGESLARATSLRVVVVTLGRTRRAALPELARQARQAGPPLVVVVLDRGDSVTRPTGASADTGAADSRTGTGEHQDLARARQ